LPPEPIRSAAGRGAFLVAAASVVWSSGALIVRLVGADPWTVNVWRGLFSSTLLVLAAQLTQRGSLVEQWRRIGWPGLAITACLSLSSTCFILALSLTSVADTLILMSIGPFVAALLGWLLLGERVGRRTWLTMAVALVGTVVMVSGSYATGTITGDLLAVVTATGFATATVLMRRHPETPMAAATALAPAMTCLVALPMATPSSVGAWGLGLLAVFGLSHALGFLLFTAGARLIPAAETSVITMLEVVLGPLWVWLALGENPGVASLIGGALILAALLVRAVLERTSPSAVDFPSGHPSPGGTTPCETSSSASTSSVTPSRSRRAGT
jgi:drug/metabolite transporter (DMT)-like permease